LSHGNTIVGPKSRARRTRRPRFVHDTRGSVAFEAIWATLFLTVLLAIGLFLFQIVKTGGSAPIDNRTAGRNSALNEICSPRGPIQGLPGSVGLRDDSQILIRCDRTVNAESRMPRQDDHFWRALTRVGDAEFANFNREQREHFVIYAVESEQTTLFSREFSIGDNVLAEFMTYSNAALAPTADTWRFDIDAWAEGHDRVVWDRLQRPHRELFPRVYPSAIGQAP